MESPESSDQDQRKPEAQADEEVEAPEAAESESGRTDSPGSVSPSRDELEAVAQELGIEDDETKTQAAQLIAATFAGPLPPPAVVRAYEDILPGSFERLLKLHEDEADHRRLIERRLADSAITGDKQGRWFGFVVALVGLIGAILLIYKDHSVLGLAAILGELTMLTGVFIWTEHQRSQQDEPEE